MSIWGSIGDGEVAALENSGDAANYRGEGEPDIVVDVATATSWHKLIRLALISDGEGTVDEECLLTSAAARQVAGWLVTAADRVDGAR